MPAQQYFHSLNKNSNPAICDTIAPETRTFINYLSANSVRPNDTRITVIDTFVRAMIACGAWYRRDQIKLLAADTEFASKINLKNPGSNTSVYNGGYTFTTDRGFAGDGSTGYADMNMKLLTETSLYTQDSASIGLYKRTESDTDGDIVVGTTTPLFRVILFCRLSGSSYGAVNNNSAAGYHTVTNASSKGYFLTRRLVAAVNSNLIYKNGTQLAGNTSTISAALPDLSPMLGAQNLAGAITPFSTGEYAAFMIGADLADPSSLGEYNAIQAYMTSIGAQV